MLIYPQYITGSKNGWKAKQNWVAKSKYIHSEVYKYETYVEALRNAIAMRVKKQGERKLERSLARSMTSFHRRSSEVEVREGLHEEVSGLSRDTSREMDEGDLREDEEAPVTPVATRTRKAARAQN